MVCHAGGLGSSTELCVPSAGGANPEQPGELDVTDEDLKDLKEIKASVQELCGLIKGSPVQGAPRGLIQQVAEHEIILRGTGSKPGLLEEFRRHQWVSAWMERTLCALAGASLTVILKIIITILGG
jgi:hypothetical protein